jgi:hypothetical protein
MVRFFSFRYGQCCVVIPRIWFLPLEKAPIQECRFPFKFRLIFSSRKPQWQLLSSQRDSIEETAGIPRHRQRQFVETCTCTFVGYLLGICSLRIANFRVDSVNLDGDVDLSQRAGIVFVWFAPSVDEMR